MTSKLVICCIFFAMVGSELVCKAEKADFELNDALSQKNQIAEKQTRLLQKLEALEEIIEQLSRINSFQINLRSNYNENSDDNIDRRNKRPSISSSRLKGRKASAS
jgi:hypothetical protein